MAAVMPQERFKSPPPLEGMDVTDVQWLTRAWTWVFEKLVHLDSCVDDVKDAVKDSRQEDTDLSRRIEAHQRFHDLMEAERKGEQKATQKWFGWTSEALKEAPKVLVAVAFFAGGGIAALITQLF